MNGIFNILENIWRNYSTPLSILAVVIVLWAYTAHISNGFPTLSGKRILLLIAHPDDEAMFFSPAVTALTREELGNHLRIMCLSNGNAEGLGEVRTKELEKSAKFLGVKDTRDVIVLNDVNLQDSMTSTWSPEYICTMLSESFAPGLSKAAKKKSTSTSTPTLIDVLITFDSDGVSFHPNHKACYEGSRLFLDALRKDRDGWECPVNVYTLKSVPTIRKYLWLGDSVITMLTCAFAIFQERNGRGKGRRRPGNERKSEYPTPLLYINGFFSWHKAQKAMVSGHWSQMVWFRWGWIGIGRYLMINDLRKM